MVGRSTGCWKRVEAQAQEHMHPEIQTYEALTGIQERHACLFKLDPAEDDSELYSCGNNDDPYKRDPASF
jgi:hypothetical protein